MSISLIVTLGLIVFAILYVIVGLFTMSLNDFLEKKIIGRFVWLWLPFHAFKRLTREFREKYLK